MLRTQRLYRGSRGALLRKRAPHGDGDPTYTDTGWQAGNAQTVALTDDSGYLWFFAAANAAVTYNNPQSTEFQPIQDAFATCP